MARQRLSEFRAKTILASALERSFAGVSIDAEKPLGPQLQFAGGRYVIKVDQGIKGRMKKGLVLLDQAPSDIEAGIKRLRKHGYRYFIVEPMQAHESGDERYVAFSSDRSGTAILFSRKGGIDVESQADAVERVPATTAGIAKAAAALGLETDLLTTLYDAYVSTYSPFLEINPLVVVAGQPEFLDVAAEVDDAATPLVHNLWAPSDFRAFRTRTPQEIAVAELANSSQASFQLEVLNKDGGIFVLLSGGGASIVVADEVNNQGYGSQLANYGEYSGGPTAAETYQYTRQVLSLLMESKAPSKILIIAGAVANFTDVRTTFMGVIQAINEVGPKLKKQRVKVFVRRGGPHQEEGLANLHSALEHHDLLGQVSGPDVMLAEIVTAAMPTLGAAR